MNVGTLDNLKARFRQQIQTLKLKYYKGYDIKEKPIHNIKTLKTAGIPLPLRKCNLIKIDQRNDPVIRIQVVGCTTVSQQVTLRFL